MKTIHKLILSVLTVSPLTFSSCVDDLAIGTPLYPEKGENLEVVAFIDNHCFNPKNFFESKVIQTMSKDQMFMSEQKISLKVQLTNAATSDLTFTLVSDKEKSNTDKSLVVLSDDAIAFDVRQVTIKSGELESQESLVFTLNPESESLQSFEGSAIAKLKLVSQDGVKISEDYDSYVWKVNKEITNINENGDLSTKVMIPVEQTQYLENSYGLLRPGTDLTDDDPETYSMGYKGVDTANIRFRFSEAQDVVGIEIYPYNYWGSYELSSAKVTIYGGMEEETAERPLQKIGTVTCKNPVPTVASHGPWKIEFYSPVKVKHIRIERLEAFNKESSIFTDDEVRFYKNK